LKTEVKKWLLF